jgi:4-amino-4-deoxy-L-arabinose transferase-like glycosyltransferase
MSAIEPPPVSPAPGAATASRPWIALSPQSAAWVAGLWTLALVLVNLLAHPTPLYEVETDLVGEYLPAASQFVRGVLDVSHFTYKGPGYPLLLAVFAAPFHGDVALAARLLSPIAAGVAAWLAFLLARRAAGEAVGTFTLIAMLAMPIHVRYAIEAGTDAPALALMLGSTWLLLRGGARSLLAAGFLAGYAILTRGNAVFLLPAAAIVLSTGGTRARSLAAYALGAAVPLAAWAFVAARAGGLPPDHNYLNVAWELYGRGVPWDQFEPTAGRRFHSLLDVLGYAPLQAALHIARNLGLQRWLDLGQLTTPWLGLLAVPGFAVLARCPRSRSWIGHALLCAVVLAPVFYNARFALYLLPVYLAAAGSALEWLAGRTREFARASTARGRALRFATPGVALAALLASGVTATTESAHRLADAPHETRIAGRALARLDAAAGPIVARKPHVAYFAGVRFVPIPSEPALRDLPAAARAQGARYLFFSGLELIMRPGYGVLSDSGVSLPGFEQVLWARLPREHFYAVYRLTGARADSATFARAYRLALAQYERRRPGSELAALFVAVQLIDLGAPREALVRLDRLERAGIRTVPVEQYRSTALLAAGDLEGAARACQAAMALETPTGWHWARMGEIRARQSRFTEARDCFFRAVEIEPANLAYLDALGRVQVTIHDYARAAVTFERGVRLAPRDPLMRRYAIGAWKLAGNEARARMMFAAGRSAGISAAALTGAP